ncbi:MAG: hypothetical protein R3F60_32315 [bacterium]
MRFHDPRQVIERMARVDDAERGAAPAPHLAGRFESALGSLPADPSILPSTISTRCAPIREPDEPLAQSGLFLARFEIENLDRPSSWPAADIEAHAEPDPCGPLAPRHHRAAHEDQRATPASGAGSPSWPPPAFTSCGTAQRKRCELRQRPARCRPLRGHCGAGQPGLEMSMKITGFPDREGAARAA